MATVKADMTAQVSKTKEEIFALLHERYEKNYRDAEALATCPDTIDLRRKLLASHSDLFGFGRQKETPTININYLGLLPDSIREAIHPTVYDEHGNAQKITREDLQ